MEAAPPFDAATTEKPREEYAVRNRTANLRNHIERLETILPKMPEGDVKRKDAARLAESGTSHLDGRPIQARDRRSVAFVQIRSESERGKLY